MKGLPRVFYSFSSVCSLPLLYFGFFSVPRGPGTLFGRILDLHVSNGGVKTKGGMGTK